MIVVLRLARARTSLSACGRCWSLLRTRFSRRSRAPRRFPLDGGPRRFFFHNALDVFSVFILQRLQLVVQWPALLFISPTHLIEQRSQPFLAFQFHLRCHPGLCSAGECGNPTTLQRLGRPDRPLLSFVHRTYGERVPVKDGLVVEIGHKSAVFFFAVDDAPLFG